VVEVEGRAEDEESIVILSEDEWDEMLELSKGWVHGYHGTRLRNHDLALRERVQQLERQLGLSCGAETSYSGGVLARCTQPKDHDGEHRGLDRWGMTTIWPLIPDENTE
jgi:hypothetical protein